MEMAVALIDHMSSLDPHRLFRPKEKFDARQYIEARLQKILTENGKVFVAFVDDVVAGYLMATIEDTSGIDVLNKFPIKKGVIDALFVSDSYRGQGISTILLAKIEDYFKSEGCGYSEVSCLASNDQVRRAYLTQGYQERTIDFLKKL